MEVSMDGDDTLVARMDGAETRSVGEVQLDIVRAGSGRVKRMIYPPGFRWSKHMKPIVHTDYCMHAHIGFLARGEVHIQYSDGCQLQFVAPQVMSIEPEHDGWVVGPEPAVVIEFDFEGETARRYGMPERHQHR